MLVFYLFFFFKFHRAFNTVWCIPVITCLRWLKWKLKEKKTAFCLLLLSHLLWIIFRRSSITSRYTLFIFLSCFIIAHLFHAFDFAVFPSIHFQMFDLWYMCTDASMNRRTPCAQKYANIVWCPFNAYEFKELLMFVGRSVLGWFRYRWCNMKIKTKGQKNTKINK